MKTSRVDTWVASIPDRPGGLAAKLKTLASGGVNLEFIIARRVGDDNRKGLVFVTPITGAKQIGVAGSSGFTRTSSLHTVRVEGVNKSGQGERMTTALADAGLNLRGLSAAAIGTKFVCYIALDTEANAAKACGVSLRR